VTRALAAAVALAVALALACNHAQPPPHTQLGADADRESDARRDDRFKSELQDDILQAYARDEPPETATDMIRPEIGAARIGVGPDDFRTDDELRVAPSRWPLRVDASTPSQPISKHLDPQHIWLSHDRTAAWVYDEISWRIKVCSRIAVVPLRMTALYAHDGDRWIPVFEHLSFARTPVPAPDGSMRGVDLKSKKMPEISDDLSRVIARLFRYEPGTTADGSDALLLGPDIGEEWAGSAIGKAGLPATMLVAEDRRVGIIGRTVSKATIAYWVGNFDADYPPRPGISGGKIRLRGSFVFEKRGGAWTLVQGHLSEPIDDLELATAVFGTALVSLDPLRVLCD
jgi:hypothetical protein